MILVGNSRGGGQNLAAHLMKDENEHVEVHELRGFASETLHGAFKEAYALSRATKAQKYLFSLSLNPPEHESVETPTFEAAIAKIEDRLGLTDQPRAIVFHEKDGRRHCHAVWSRVDGEALKAIPMDFHKRKLQEVARELYLERGWQMPRGFLSKEPSDPKNFTLEEWQQAKRQGKDVRKMKAVFQESWAISDSGTTFAHALKEHGLILARGDRRGYVAVDRSGEAYAIARWTGNRTKAVRDKLGDPKHLPSIETAMAQHAKEMTPAFDRWDKELTTRAAKVKETQTRQRAAMIKTHRRQRTAFLEKLEQRRIEEAQARQARFRKGFKGLWDRLRGRHKQMVRRNEQEARACDRRDRAEKDKLAFTQLAERRALKERHKLQREQLKEQQQALQQDRSRHVRAPDMSRQRTRTPRSRDGPEYER